MVPAKAADRVQDPVHLPEGHAVHLLIKLVEVLFDSAVVHGVDLGVGFVEHGQNGLAAAGRMGVDVGSEGCVKVSQGKHLQKSLCDVSLDLRKNQVLISKTVPQKQREGNSQRGPRCGAVWTFPGMVRKVHGTGEVSRWLRSIRAILGKTGPKTPPLNRTDK